MGEPSLLDRIQVGNRGTPPPAPPRRSIAVVIVAALGLIATKAKAIGLLALKFGATAWTMALAIWAYSTQVGWAFAALFIGLVLIHEIGHGVAARLVGIRVGAPMFIPFFGAFVALRDRPADRWQHFIIAAGGPLAGGAASLACLAASLLVDGDARRLLYGCGFLSLLVNLFNLLPVWILDGSKMLPVIGTTDGIVGLVAVGATVLGSALWRGHLNGLAVIVMLVVAWEIAMGARKVRRVPESLLERLQPGAVAPAASAQDVPVDRRQRGALVYFGMIAVYAAMIQIGDPTLAAP